MSMPDVWFEPSERASIPQQVRSCSGILVSLLGHAILIGALIWAGKQWVPVTPPETIEVMLMELPTEELEPTTAQAQPAAPPPQKALTPKPQTAPVPSKPLIEPAKTAPVSEQLADINTGEKPPTPVIKPPSPPVELQKSQPTPSEPIKEVSPARVDARYASSNPRPQYPSMARRLGQEGTVMLEVIVTVEGLAKSVKIQESSGHELLDQAALQAISRWKFVPAKRGDLPIEQKLSTRWTYKLEE